MDGLPEFGCAVSDFRRFLAEQGHRDDLLWVFRDDLWRRGSDRVLVRYPPPTENNHLAQKVYEEGRARGLVSITAIAATEGRTAATVWFPKFPDEEVQGWSRGLRLSVCQPLPEAETCSGWRWRVIKLLPGYRRSQRNEWSVGSRRWAAA